MQNVNDVKIAIVGLGYVGLPLAVELGNQFDVVGFDINQRRVDELRRGEDNTREVTSDELRATERLKFSSDAAEIADCTFYIVTVPTPIDANKAPDLTPLLGATRTIGKMLKRGDVVVYESTVYPGCTEEKCVPLLEELSGLTFNADFFVGYSPERINPGDREHRLPDIRKIVSGSTPEAARLVEAVYGRIIRAGTFMAESIRVAEAAKVIENTQRDVNIALINELAILFHKLGLDTEAVLTAAGTKWNFLPFRPGLVGGHCIGVDPYYLTHKAKEVGHHPEIILAGRRLNDGMGAYVVGEMVKAMLGRGLPVHGARFLVLGITFKENCPDLRNTRVIDMIGELKSYGAEVDVHDPWANAEEALDDCGVTLISNPSPGAYDGIVLAVAHDEFRRLGAGQIRSFGRAAHLFLDLKSVFRADESDLRL